MFMTILLLGIGSFSLAGAIFNWDWFMHSRRAARLARSIGRSGARIFYALLGLTLIVIGVLNWFGVITLG